MSFMLHLFSKYLFIVYHFKSIKNGYVSFVPKKFRSILKLAVDEPSAPTARPPAGGSLRSPTPPPTARKIYPKNFLLKKKMKSKIFEEKKMKSIYEENFVFRFSKKNFRRNLSYDEYITHAKLHDHRSRGFGATGANTQTDLRIYHNIDVEEAFSKVSLTRQISYTLAELLQSSLTTFLCVLSRIFDTPFPKMDDSDSFSV